MNPVTELRVDRPSAFTAGQTRAIVGELVRIGCHVLDQQTRNFHQHGTAGAPE